MTPPSVSEDMIRAALKGARSSIITGFDTIPTLAKIDAALEALAHLPAGSEAVKPLEWAWEAPYLVARVLGGHYSIEKWEQEDRYDLRGTFLRATGAFKTKEDAKAAAQADFERRVLSCLAPPSTPPAANVQEGEADLSTILLRIVDAYDDVIAPLAKQSIRDAAEALRSKQAPTVAVPDEDDRIENAKQAMSETHSSWESGCHAIMAALGIDYGRMDEFLPDADARAEQRETPSGVVGEVPTHRHKKRGSEYVLIGFGKMQAEHWLDTYVPSFLGATSVDMREVAIYRSVDDGSLWVRPREEFEDGRFEALQTKDKSHE